MLSAASNSPHQAYGGRQAMFILAAVVFNVVCVVTCLTWQAFAKLDDFAPKYQWLVITKMAN